MPDSPLDKQNFTSYPMVIKVGNGHAGRGKVKVNGANDFRDIKGILALDQEYYTYVLGRFNLLIM